MIRVVEPAYETSYAPYMREACRLLSSKVPPTPKPIVYVGLAEDEMAVGVRRGREVVVSAEGKHGDNEQASDWFFSLLIKGHSTEMMIGRS